MTTEATAKRPVHLGAHFPGVNHTTVWSDPASGSHIDFTSFEALARTAERGLFDFFFLAEGLRLREHRGRIHDLDVVGRPDTFPVLAALAAVTERLGLIGTINATFNEPYEVARQFATLDHLSGGRAGWNVVTSPDAFTGANFRLGGYLPREERYEHAAELVDVARLLWGSWPEPVSFHGRHHDVEGRFDLPPGPQGEPVLLQAGDSEDGRDFGASHADAIFTPGRPIEAARAFSRAVKDRLPALGRRDEDLLVLPGVTFVLGDTDADAEERAAEVRRQQVSGPTAVRLLELLWNRDLSYLDPDGPLPEEDPFLGESDVVQGQVQHHRDRLATAREWRELAEAKGFSVRELMIEKASRQTFVGSPRTVAARMDEWVQTGASDGFILVPHLTPGGLDAFVDLVVPELQDRGVHRTAYTGTTLRDHLGLPRRGSARPGDLR